jgi:aryl-alcohol dehydrogenase-like predicted oxidoreductase
LQVSVIGLGTNRFGSPNVPEEKVKDILDYAAEAGINMLDTADVYQGGRSEETLGKALKGRWDKFVLATKVHASTGPGPNDRGGSRYHIMNGVEASLRRLQSDHIDLYYMHNWDAGTPIDETLRALDDLVHSGKVRYLGASNYAAWQLAHSNLLAELKGWTQFSVIQSEYSLLNRKVEAEVLPYCRTQNVGFVPYFPLAGGFLTGKYQRGQAAPAGSRGESSPYVQGFMKPEVFDVVEKLTAWAQGKGRGLNELAQAWLLAQPKVCSVLSGATKLEQVQANVKAMDWALSADDLKEIAGILG